MKTLSLTIHLDNDALVDTVAAATLLRGVAFSIESGILAYAIKDANGNRVGEFAVSDDEPVEAALLTAADDTQNGFGLVDIDRAIYHVEGDTNTTFNPNARAEITSRLLASDFWFMTRGTSRSADGIERLEDCVKSLSSEYTMWARMPRY